MHNMLTEKFAVGKLGFSVSGMTGGKTGENYQYSWVAKKSLSYAGAKVQTVE